MSIKINKDQNFINITNNVVSLTFYIRGKKKGTFEITYSITKNEKYCLEKCYSAINFLIQKTDQVKELSSKNFEFVYQVKDLKDSIGIGKKILLNTEKTNNPKISFTIQFKIYENHEFILAKIIDITNNEKVQERVHSISPFIIKDSNLWLSKAKNPTKLNSISWFKQGWQSWSACKLLFGYEKDNEGSEIEIFKRVFDNQDYIIKGKFYSEYCTVITDLNSKNSLILGFVSFNDQFTRIVLDFEENNKIKLLTAFGCMDGVYLNSSSIKFSEELFISFKTKNLGYYGLINYAEIVKKINNIGINKTIPAGWCSWYYYFTDISESAMIKNLEFFHKNNDFIPINFILLDDGYFTHIGDYNKLNSKFPNGLAYLFNRVNKYGFKSGIWTAPFFAEKRSELFKLHRNWLLKDKKTKKLLKVHYGLSWNVYLYGLDLSKQEVLEYLNKFYRDLLYANESDQDFDNLLITLFKIDFLHAAVPIEGDFSKKNLTRAQILYNGVKTIRDAITNKCFLLGCGAPLGPCVGLVDAMRIGEDTEPKWEETNKNLIESGISTPSLKISLINIIYRSFMHRGFWINDPDCLMIRRTETELTLTEIRLQLTIMGLSGGQILISDDMTKLSKEEINDAKLLIPPYNPSNHFPIVVDAFISKHPTIYTLETNEIIGKRYLVAIINWDDNNINRKLKIKDIILNNKSDHQEYLIFNFWERRLLGKYRFNQETEPFTLKPHSCMYLSIIPIDNEILLEPIILSTSLHISQGCCDIKSYHYDNKKGLISINIELIGQRKGKIYLKLPLEKRVIDYNSYFQIIDKKQNIWELSIEFENSINVEVGLS